MTTLLLIFRSFLIVFGCALVAQLLTNTLTGGADYWQSHSWPMACALLSAASLIRWHCKFIERSAGHMPPPAVMERVRVLKWCAVIAAGFGLYVVLANKSPSAINSHVAPAATTHAR